MPGAPARRSGAMESSFLAPDDAVGGFGGRSPTARERAVGDRIRRSRELFARYLTPPAGADRS